MSKRILAIETSCDETAIALVEASGTKSRPKFEMLAEIIASQVKTHRPYGGVVPNLAKREHIQNLPIVLEKLKKSLKPKTQNLKPDIVAVTIGPGLEPCLWVGLNFAKDLAQQLNVPLVGVNHLEGHLFSNWLPKPNKYHSNILENIRMIENKISFPAITLLVSGGHTILLLMTSLRRWKILGETRDDAVGEAYDKVAKMLGLPYPGGPEIERSAKQFSSLRGAQRRGNLINFPRPMIHDKNYDFSFSGLKTAVLYYLRDNLKPKTHDLKPLVCASFQAAAVDVLVHKTMRAVKEFKAKLVLLCGGVAANKSLQRELKKAIRFASRRTKFAINFYNPPAKYNTDNATMIAAAAHLGTPHPTAKPIPNLSLQPY